MNNFVAIDTETFLIRPGLLAPPLVCLTACDAGLKPSLFRGAAIKEVLEDFLDAPNLTLVGHNVAYDMAVIANAFPDLLPKIFWAYEGSRIEDTKIRAQLIDLADGHLNFDEHTGKAQGYSLADLVKRNFSVELDKDTWRLRYEELHAQKEWPESAKQYALKDALWTAILFSKQNERKDILDDSKRQAAYAFALHLMSCWGLTVDKDAVDELELEIGGAKDALFQLLQYKGLIKPTGTKDLKKTRELVVRALGKATPLTEKGNVRTDADVLKHSGNEALEKLAEYGALEKISSTYLEALKDGFQAPIQPSYNVLVASGRTSSYKPNIQNQPRFPGIRECFIPRKGFLFCSVDYDALELRTLAQVCLSVLKKSTLAEALNSGLDPHLDLAAHLMGSTYDRAYRLKKDGDASLKKYRQLSKAANFGYPGGMGAEKFRLFAKASYGVQLSVEEAQNLRKAWFERWPEMREYFAWIGTLIQGGVGTIKQLGSNRVRGLVGFCDGCNSFFQGLAADGAKHALFNVSKACYIDKKNALYGSRPVAFIHDEILTEVPEDTAHEAAQEMVRIMCETMQLWVPDVIITASPALMRRWRKDACEKYKDGNLIPWEDSA